MYLIPNSHRLVIHPILDLCPFTPSTPTVPLPSARAFISTNVCFVTSSVITAELQRQRVDSRRSRRAPGGRTASGQLVSCPRFCWQTSTTSDCPFSLCSWLVCSRCSGSVKTMCVWQSSKGWSAVLDNGQFTAAGRKPSHRFDRVVVKYRPSAAKHIYLWM